MSIPAIAPYPMPTAAELPRNQARWVCDASRAALLIHDMQRYFIKFFPPDHQPVTDLMRNVAALRAGAVAAGVPVIYTAQPGGMTREQRGLLHDIWGPGMSSDPYERQIVPEVGPAASDTVIDKWRYSAFARSNLREILHRLGRDQLIICGVYAHVGCLITACDAFTNDVQAFLVADAIADFTPEYHQLALKYAAERCAVTLPTETVVASLSPAFR
ncbi:MAG TPA: isochorismatase family protein [Streptosporangiaceae bacterium]|nr:isochorismatase family protein [Streptosporangiaceae bacterium]